MPSRWVVAAFCASAVLPGSILFPGTAQAQGALVKVTLIGSQPEPDLETGGNKRVEQTANRRRSFGARPGDSRGTPWNESAAVTTHRQDRRRGSWRPLP